MSEKYVPSLLDINADGKWKGSGLASNVLPHFSFMNSKDATESRHLDTEEK